MQQPSMKLIVLQEDISGRQMLLGEMIIRCSAGVVVVFYKSVQPDL
jgi:hypothetical protein